MEKGEFLFIISVLFLFFSFLLGLELLGNKNSEDHFLKSSELIIITENKNQIYLIDSFKYLDGKTYGLFEIKDKNIFVMELMKHEN